MLKSLLKYKTRRTINIKMLVVIILEVLAHISLCASQTPVYVNTKVGNIMGYQEHISFDGEQKLVSRFLGIPFAESTGGKNRFRKPVPKAPFNETFDARKTPAACYQQSEKKNDALKNLYSVSEFSEDCLTLNIYVPNELRADDLRPVMIWVYGGGFTQGASSLYHPEGLAIFGNVIVVTINYRIGMFGFLRDPKGIFPGNQGLWDQHLAFKWVHNHIEKFYGYKDEITIFGQSAGGASVIFQALYPGNKGLFKRVIAQSGSAIASWAIQNMTRFERYFNEQGCDPTAKIFAECLQSKTPMSLLSDVTNFGPVVDGDFVVASPFEIMSGNSKETARARDFFASLDIIVGANDKDGAGLIGIYQNALNLSSRDFNISEEDFRRTVVPTLIDLTLLSEDIDTKAELEKVLQFFYTDWNDPDNYVSIWQQITEMSTDAAFFSPASQTVDAHARLNVGKSYMFEFGVQTRNNFVHLPPWMKGSSHGGELLFLFGSALGVNISMFGRRNFSLTSGEIQVTYATMGMWSNFAKSGNPNIPMDITQFTNTTWPAYDMMSQRYFRISDQMSPASIIEGFYPRRMTFWSDIVPLLSKQHCCVDKQTNMLHFDPSTELVG